MAYSEHIKKEILSKYESGTSQYQLEKEYSISRETIRKWLRQAGVEEHYFKSKYLDKDKVVKMYVEDAMSVLKIAAELGVGRRPIEVILFNAKVRKRDNSEALLGRYSGKKNPNYKGGNAREHLRKLIPSIIFIQEAWKEIILGLDNEECRMCKTREGRLEANHIVSMRQIYRSKLPIELAWNLNNGITLCRKCHLSIHMKEESFQKQFQELVKNRVNSVDPLKMQRLNKLTSSALGKYRAKLIRNDEKA